MCMADSPRVRRVYLAAMRIGAVPVPVSTMLQRRRTWPSCCATPGPGWSRSRRVSPRPPPARRAASCRSGRRLASCDRAPIPVHGLRALADGRDRRPRATRPTGGLPGVLALHLGHHRHAQGRDAPARLGPRSSARPTAPRCSASGPTTAACRRPRRSSPTAWATRCCSRCRSARRPSWSRRRRSPDVMAERAGEYGATLFFAGPTFFANMLRAGLPADALAGVRLAASAGEALPAPLYERWTERFGVDILDGIGMTEMLHIFLSNRPGRVRPGTTGDAVPGYELRILDDDGAGGPAGHPGHAVRARRVGGRPATGAVTTPPARCSRASGCAPATPTSRTPTATTPAWAAPTTCSRPAASGYRPPRSRSGCSPTRRSTAGGRRLGHRRRRPGKAGRLRHLEHRVTEPRTT